MSQYSGSRKVNNFGAVILYILFCLFFFSINPAAHMDAENRSRLPSHSPPTPHSDRISCKALFQVSRSSESQLGVDFNFICDCLSALGVTRKTISSPPLKFRGLSISNL